MASRPSMVEMPMILLLAMTVFVASSSTIVEPQDIQNSSTNLPQFFSSQWSNDKMFNLQQCWAAFTRIGVCVDEINAYLRILQSGGGGGALTGLIGPVCCDVAKLMHEHCWPELIPDPFYLKVKFICAYHPLPSISPPVGPPPTTQEPEYPSPSPAPQDPSSGPPPPLDQAPAPAPQDPPQSPTLPQYPTITDPQNPPDSSTPLQSPDPSPSAPQDPMPSSPTLQYTYPTPPGPPYKI